MKTLEAQKRKKKKDAAAELENAKELKRDFREINCRIKGEIWRRWPFIWFYHKQTNRRCNAKITQD